MARRTRVYSPIKPRTKTERGRQYQRDPEAQRFYVSAVWRALRAEKLAIDPLCEVCKAAGRLTPAQQVHHVKERRGRPDLALDMANLQSICIRCHNRQRAAGRG